MYERFMKLIENGSEKITKNLMREIQEREEVRHYRDRDISKEVSFGLFLLTQFPSISYTLRITWEMNSSDTMFAYYSDLGAQRCREGIPLEEVIMLIMLIKRQILDAIKNEPEVFIGLTLNQLLEINFYVNLFFDQIIHSTVIGYQDEQGRTNEKTGSIYNH
ncbi:MAG: hypothetical protein ABSA71_08795 [Desulfomonilia bacterium]